MSSLFALSTSPVLLCCIQFHHKLPLLDTHNVITRNSSQTTVKKHVMRAALKKGVESGTLVQVKNSYKVSPDEKKKKLPSAAKAPAAKKTATKAKVSALDF